MRPLHDARCPAKLNLFLHVVGAGPTAITLLESLVG